MWTKLYTQAQKAMQVYLSELPKQLKRSYGRNLPKQQKILKYVYPTWCSRRECTIDYDRVIIYLYYPASSSF
jgi:mRNA-degrading endonuclease YafQ of YafQ-DinJ toxin-antitoxin module